MIFLIGLAIGLLVGYLIGVNIKSSGTTPKKEFEYEYDYSDPDDRQEKDSAYYYGIKEVKGIDSQWLDPDSSAEPNNIFYGMKIVFTGNLESIERNDAAMYISKLGGNVNKSISRKTDIVVIGGNPGPSKMEKVAEINLTRQPLIQLMNEDELLSVIHEHFDL